MICDARQAPTMSDRGKEGARRVTEISVKMCTHRRRSNRQETTNGVDSKHRGCLWSPQYHSGGDGSLTSKMMTEKKLRNILTK